MPDATGNGPWIPKIPPLAPPSGTSTSGNAIAGIPLSWHQMLISAFVIGVSIWLVEQNVSNGAAMILALIIILGVAMMTKGFTAELQAITKGGA